MILYFWGTCSQPVGHRTSVVVVATDGVEPLPARHDLWRYDDGPFRWGPLATAKQKKQLALCLLSALLRDDELAVALHESFARDFLTYVPPGQDLEIAAESLWDWALGEARDYLLDEEYGMPVGEV